MNCPPLYHLCLLFLLCHPSDTKKGSGVSQCFSSCSEPRSFIFLFDVYMLLKSYVEWLCRTTKRTSLVTCLWIATVILFAEVKTLDPLSASRKKKVMSATFSTDNVNKGKPDQQFLVLLASIDKSEQTHTKKLQDYWKQSSRNCVDLWIYRLDSNNNSSLRPWEKRT